MVKKALFISLIIMLAVLTALYFIDEGVLIEAENTASHFQHELKYNVAKSKLKGKQLTENLSDKAQKKKEAIKDDLYDLKEALDRKTPDEGVLQTITLKIKGVFNRIENNAKNIFTRVIEKSQEG